MANPQNIVEHKFPKGKSGNPQGKPKGTLSAKVIIRKWLASQEKIKNPLTQKDEIVTVLDSMTLAQIAKARKGDTAAFNALLDRTEGKPNQSVELSGNVEAPLNFILDERYKTDTGKNDAGLPT